MIPLSWLLGGFILVAVVRASITRFWFQELERSYTAGLFAATLNFNPSKVVNFFVDTGVQAPEERNGKASMIVDAGGALIIGHNIQLDLRP